MATGATTALMKDNGRIRGIGTGDIFRQGWRTMAQQCALKFERSLHAVPVRVLNANGNRLRRTCGQVSDGARSRKTLLCIDGIVSFDHIKRKAILEASTPTQNERQCSRLSGSSTVQTPGSCGVTMVWRTRRVKDKRASRETLSCHLCVLWVSTQISHKSVPLCVRAR